MDFPRLTCKYSSHDASVGPLSLESTFHNHKCNYLSEKSTFMSYERFSTAAVNWDLSQQHDLRPGFWHSIFNGLLTY